MTSNLNRPVEDAHRSIGSGKRELPSDSIGRNRVLVEIEADIDGLRRTYGLDAFHWKWVRGVR